AQITNVTMPVGLQNTQPLAITENTSFIAELMGEGSTLRNWTWTPNNKNEIDHCTGINGFDTNHAVASI
ncbi:MAG: hypothetical protein ACI8VW_003711, partial [bacterium]